MDLIKSIYFNDIDITNIFINKIKERNDFILNNKTFNINNSQHNYDFCIITYKNGSTRILNIDTYFNSNINYKLYLKTISNINLSNLNEAINHYILNGNILYDKKINTFRNLNIIPSEYDYYYELDAFKEQYYDNRNIIDIFNIICKDPKIAFKYFCFRYLDYIKHIKLPDIKLNSNKEAIVIEFRQFPHIEFLLRNTILKLGSEWSHTIVCGNGNYNMVNNIVNSITCNIRIIKYNIDNLDQSNYSKLLVSTDFWKQFVGEKLLIYQEDSCIFNTHIDDFIHYDYIGAPWPKQFNNPHNVGNGGFSLRSKSVMLEVIDKISIYNTQFSPHTSNYIKYNKLNTPPEDVYFSKNITEYKLGNVADWDTAHKFSVEILYYENPLAGHNFWLSYKNWKNLLYKKVVKQYHLDTLTQNISTKIQNMIRNDFIVDINNTDNHNTIAIISTNDYADLFI